MNKWKCFCLNKTKVKANAHAYELGVLSDQVLSEPTRSLDPMELIVELEP